MLARRVFADGRTRAYAWGRSAAREDLAAVGERLIAMSGQFEQRRLARPSYQLDVLDAFCGEDQLRRRADLRLAWRDLQAARRRLEEAGDESSRLEELQALADDTDGLEVGAEESLGPSASGCGTSTSSRAQPRPQPTRSRRTRATAPPDWRRWPSVPSRPSSRSPRSWRARGGAADATVRPPRHRRGAARLPPGARGRSRAAGARRVRARAYRGPQAAVPRGELRRAARARGGGADRAHRRGRPGRRGATRGRRGAGAGGRARGASCRDVRRGGRPVRRRRSPGSSGARHGRRRVPGTACASASRLHPARTAWTS